jgi:hypothetical protein
MGPRPERSEGCLANARQDKERLKGLRLHVPINLGHIALWMSKPALLKKGLLRAEPSGHPEGA